MSATREDILQELGLWPQWRRRDAPAAGVSALVSAAESAPAAALPVAGAEPARAAARVTMTTPSAALPLDQRIAAVATMDWSQLKDSVAACTACPLHTARDKTVFGAGDENADWLFVGDAPGADEDLNGEPFVGQAGRLLDNMLAAMKLRRGQNGYVANVVKCRPPDNRKPEAAEVAQCEPYLHRQIEMIRPRLIIALGQVAAVSLLKREAAVSSLRGKIHDYRGIPMIVTYHPAYLLRTLPDKAQAWQDLCFAMETMQGLQLAQAAPI